MSIDAQHVGDDWVSSMPTIYMQIQKAIDDPDSSFKDIAKIISGDPALSSRLLKIVNSPFYGFSSKIETITHALNIVGTEQLNELVLATSVINSFQGVSKDLISMDSFWRHSIACGLAARIIAKNRHESEAERFYVAGMLHDIGSLVIYKKMPGRSKEILLQCIDKKEPMFKMERKAFGFDHAAVGRTLLKAWQLPGRLVESVAYHHDPSKAALYPVETAIIHIADILAYDMKLGKSGSAEVPAMDPDAWDLVELSEGDLDPIKEEVQRQFDETIGMFLKK